MRCSYAHCLSTKPPQGDRDSQIVTLWQCLAGWNVQRGWLIPDIAPKRDATEVRG